MEEEEFNAITDKIPMRPMGAVEGTSYTIVIVAGAHSHCANCCTLHLSWLSGA